MFRPEDVSFTVRAVLSSPLVTMPWAPESVSVAAVPLSTLCACLTPFAKSMLCSVRFSAYGTLTLPLASLSGTAGTGIFKKPVPAADGGGEGVLCTPSAGVQGDRRGFFQEVIEERAVLQTSEACYSALRECVPGRELQPGAVGDNLVTAGVSADTVHLGDVFSNGSLEVQVLMHREPCFKLNKRFQDERLKAKVLQRACGGWFLKVLREGRVRVGDQFHLVSRTSPVSVRDLYAMEHGTLPLAFPAHLLPIMNQEYVARMKTKADAAAAAALSDAAAAASTAAALVPVWRRWLQPVPVACFIAAVAVVLW